MKQFLFFCLLTSLISCDDGDLQIEVLDFDDSTIQQCESNVTTATRIFFKINDDEALILNLQNGLLKNEVSDGVITSAVPGQSKITYRIFSDNVSKNYFCDAIPLAEPTVTDEIEAEDGEVRITSVLDEDGISFKHKIELSGISLVTENGDRITDLRISDFGEVITKP
ncbi:hypothetical protein GGR42_002848 [Saonia flava]|uniref:Uncharacterized protein n=1 Tax=Saonia flava TaxID=523696 RepID=A0A846QYS5_9FLAO|nr:hypothetical protein [Saonia flava]NJB72357.1 hypothetical protein [Saonia flava]